MIVCARTRSSNYRQQRLRIYRAHVLQSLLSYRFGVLDYTQRIRPQEPLPQLFRQGHRVSNRGSQMFILDAALLPELVDVVFSQHVLAGTSPHVTERKIGAWLLRLHDTSVVNIDQEEISGRPGVTGVGAHAMLGFAMFEPAADLCIIQERVLSRRYDAEMWLSGQQVRDCTYDGRPCICHEVSMGTRPKQECM
jgi:hypothetical protein